MKKISLFAALGAHNLGDEYIALSEYNFLRNLYPKVKIVVHTYDKTSTILPENDALLEYVPYFPDNSRKYPLKNIWRAIQTIFGIATSSLVVIGGGGIFYDNEAGQSFKNQLTGWKFRTKISNFFWIPLCFFGIGIDVSEENAKYLTPLFSGKKTTICVRDQKSKQILEQIGVHWVVEIPDPAFMGPIFQQARHRDKKSAFTVTKRPKIGISLREGYLKNEENSIREIIELCRSKGLEVVFLNHSFHKSNPKTDDSLFVEKFALEYRIPSTKTIEESYELYKELDFVIAMRLHAGVIAAKNAIPFFLISYSKKTDEFAKRLTHEYILSAKTFDFKIFAPRFESLLENAERESFAQSEKCGIIEQNTFNSYKEIVHGLE